MIVVRILGFHCHGPGSVSGQGTKILQAAWQKRKKERKVKEQYLHQKKAEFKTRDKENYYIMINGSIQKEDSTGKYVCTLNRNT